ncbi:hypothetical protein ON010_g6749 [Phytophthora cinnamomi]|nr:hypothetical protein ON010_g6749 [Phytophthora cinnamomi]
MHRNSATHPHAPPVQALNGSANKTRRGGVTSTKSPRPSSLPSSHSGPRLSIQTAATQARSSPISPAKLNMKILRPAAAGLAIMMINTAAGTDSVGAYYEDSGCSKMLLANVISGQCEDQSGCKVYQGSGISMFCVPNATEYLNTAFDGSPYVVTEEFNDINCAQPMLTRAFLADGSCHVAHEDDGRTWSMTTVVNSNGTVEVLGTDDECGGPNAFYHLEPVPKSDLNTGECVVMLGSGDSSSSYSAKFYLVNSSSTTAPLDTTTSGSDSLGSSTNDTASTTSATTTPATTNATTGSSVTSGASNLLFGSLALLCTSAAVVGATVL